MSKVISAILGSGGDAFENMYDVKIKFPWDSDGLTVLTVRADGFDVPSTESSTYEKKYHGVTMNFVKPEMKFDRKFSLSFRMDSGYGLYGNFITWLSASADPVTGGVANVGTALGEVEVIALSENFSAIHCVDNYDDEGAINADNLTKWTFKDAIVTKVDAPKFKTDGANAIKFKVDFIFGECDHPFFNGGAK